MSRLLNGGFEQGFFNLFIDLIKGLAIVFAYHFGSQLVQKKGYMPEENYHTRWEKLFNYLKGFGGCLLAAVIISNWGYYRGITGSTLEAFCLLFIPCIAGIEHSYRVLKIPIKKAKRILLIIPVLLCSLSSYSQVTKYKAYQKYWDDFKLNKPVPVDNWDSASILVVMDFTRMKVRTFGQQTGDFDLLTLKNVKDLDIGKSYLYDAIDNEGDKCTIVIQIFPDQTKRCIAALKIVYDTFGVYFRLESD
jgi:hypothetical protein